MSQKQRGAQLPGQIDGYDLVCFQLLIPDDLTYKAALMAEVLNLTKWWHWEKDGTTRGKEAAEYWREIILNSPLWNCEGEPMAYTLHQEDCNIVLKLDGVTVSSISIEGCAEPGPVGPPGTNGIDGQDGQDGFTPIPFFDEFDILWDTDGDGIPDTTPTNIRGLPGQDGECPDCPPPPGVNYPDEPPDYEDAPPDIPCSAATRMATVLETQTTELLIEAENSASIIFFFAGAFAALIQAFFAAVSVEALKVMWDIKTNELTFPPTFWEQVKCDAFCLLPSSGLFNEEIVNQLIALWGNRGSTEDDLRWTFLSLFVTAVKINGINYAERVEPNGTADCTECDCPDGCILYDYRITQGDSYKNTAIASNSATYVSGQWWHAPQITLGTSKVKQLYVRQDFPSRTVTSVKMGYDLLRGTDIYGTSQNVRIQLFNGTTLVATEFLNSSTNGDDLELVWTGSETVTSIELKLRAAATANLSQNIDAAYAHLLYCEVC